MSSYLPYLTGPACGLVLCLLALSAFVNGKVHTDKEFSKLEKENLELRTALSAERQAVNETARVGDVTNQLISALIDIAQNRAVSAHAATLEAGSGDDH